MKSLVQIFEPDVRYAGMVGKYISWKYKATICVNDRTIYSNRWETIQVLSLWDKDFHYSILKEFELPKYIPEEIRVQFDVALDVAMYAYYNWLLWDVAAHKALNCYELALRTVLRDEIIHRVIDKKKKKEIGGKEVTELDDFITFSQIIGIARAHGYITNEEYDISKEYIRKVRNMFSHNYGSLLGFPFSQHIIETCFKLICSVCEKGEQVKRRGVKGYTE